MTTTHANTDTDTDTDTVTTTNNTTAATRPLHGKVALVAGGTRGGGRGIAVELGAAGATVYVTGRSSSGGAGRSELNRPETVEETAERVTAAGGLGIPVRVDHSSPDEVRALVARIDAEQSGRLDVLVNCVWGGDPLTDWDHPLWEQDLDTGLRLLRQAVDTHVITSRFALPLMVARGSGLVVEVTDGNTARYRGSFFYDLAKSAVIRLAFAQAAELREHGVAAVAVTPGFLRSEAVLEHFGVTEDTWREAVAKDPDFAHSESPAYLGRAVAALAADPDVMAKSGRALATWSLYGEYGFTDADGSQPDFAAHWATALEPTLGPLGDPL
ncbi:SDR family oxidoreductase [Streptomyces sp. NPDC007369]|uniref:SDR family oxidoreductase n=1 Tax=Streptomyces sp. NPDC007369 TaxID=3154589 RepID=UPI0033C7F116